jgi:type IV secretory system conjugative DNA transfer VirD4/TraG family protein
MPSRPTAIVRPLLAAAVVVASLAAATQWTAALLAHHPALGAPWLDLLGLRLYAPWKVFSWWLAFGAHVPGVFVRTGTLAALGGAAAGLVAIGGAARRAGHGATPSTTYGSARWARSAGVHEAGLFAGKGIVLGVRDGRYLRRDGPEHVLAVAPTRSGKGFGLMVPTLLTWPGSAVIHDIKGENWQLTAGWRSRFSHCLLLDPTSALSARFNPLLEVRKGFHEVRDGHNIADILIDPEGARPWRDHWEKSAHSLLTGAILHVLYTEEEKALTCVASFLAGPARSIRRTMWVMLTKAHPTVASAARELLNKTDNERSGVMSTAMTLLGLYRDPIVARMTQASDSRIADLLGAERAVSLYLVVPPSDISRTRPLIRLIFNQIGRCLTERYDEVMANPDEKLWIESVPAGWRDSGQRIGAAEAERIIRLLAAHVRREATDKAPIVSAELPDTAERFDGVMPPMALAAALSYARARHAWSSAAAHVIEDAQLTETRDLAGAGPQRSKRSFMFDRPTELLPASLALSPLVRPHAGTEPWRQRAMTPAAAPSRRTNCCGTSRPSSSRPVSLARRSIAT